MPCFDHLTFDNHYSQLPDCFYSKVTPQALENPRLVSVNAGVAHLLGLDPEDHEGILTVTAGKHVPAGADPLAMVYAGHQFGVYVPRLGDGRALLLGEVRNHQGEKWDLHLKGSGHTPYSRQGDGRAVLRSSIREYLCSEAMHGLGIPTTRALCLVDSDTPVLRERKERGAAILRVAQSHVRFGTFEYFYYRNRHAELKQLADFVIAEHFPAFANEADCYERFFREVVKRTAEMIAQWQAVGFCHGVMNTDNMSILGLTLDYGPFGFMEAFDAGHICNHSDYQGRYAFNQQPDIGYWNCACLGQALSPLLNNDVDRIKGILAQYPDDFAAHYSLLIRQKAGLTVPHESDSRLLDGLFTLMQQSRTDYTLFFQRLCDFVPDGDNALLKELFVDRKAFDLWCQDYGVRLAQEPVSQVDRKSAMKQVNPKYILRNYMAQIVIDQAEAGDYSEVNTILALLSNPFSDWKQYEAYAGLPPDWSTSLEVSCSS
ncbi:protein adenylyltransferase SelO [Kistimonas asteriae]|uniref:protein adenylyltransferase SelO n=1 Tax=Kistimonas asteriae TaxID=517724 RepID=UPI001BAD6F53|nr:YdiU family protein [Kistimonas asteriae]